ncbi:alpha/beta hydrolase fold-domain-containing protein [Lenzites betulinus]|nr:alpha/beta hydrolase fold-domain-containing protein [Lenzites betulinus]
MAQSKIHQPIHPDIAGKLLDEYATFHNTHLAHAVPVHELPWDPAIRNTPAVLGGSVPLKVGAVKDLPLSKCSVRVFTPEGQAPAGGWPVFIFYHGGGWTLGTINAENAFSTNMCTRGGCVVVSVDYRLGPEEPYPAAVEDAVEALRWVYSKGKEAIGIDPTRIAVGGSSSGANLAAVVTHKAALSEPPIPLVFQLLVVPVVDNTASTTDSRYPSWQENANTVALVPEKMLWFRDNYLPNKEDWTKWDNSPIFAPEEAFKKSPPAWIGVAELDILRDEGIAYGEKLKTAGVPVEIQVYKGAPHPIMAMDGEALEVGKRLVSDAGAALAKAFGTA